MLRKVQWIKTLFFTVNMHYAQETSRMVACYLGYIMSRKKSNPNKHCDSMVRASSASTSTVVAVVPGVLSSVQWKMHDWKAKDIKLQWWKIRDLRMGNDSQIAASANPFQHYFPVLHIHSAPLLYQDSHKWSWLKLTLSPFSPFMPGGPIVVMFRPVCGEGPGGPGLPGGPGMPGRPFGPSLPRPMLPFGPDGPGGPSRPCTIHPNTSQNI